MPLELRGPSTSPYNVVEMVKFILIGVAGACLLGCRHAPSLVGTWQEISQDEQATIVFRPDGTYVSDTTLPGDYHIHNEATYRFDGHTLDATFTRRAITDSRGTHPPRGGSIATVHSHIAIDGDAMTIEDSGAGLPATKWRKSK